MAILVTCECGAQYRLKDEYAGKRGKCHKCGAVLEVPAVPQTEQPIIQPPLAQEPAVVEPPPVHEQAPVEPPTIPKQAPQEPIDPVFQRDKFLLRQKHLAISEKYYVWDEQENVLLFIQRPAHLLRNLGAVLAAFLAGGVAAALFVGISTLFPENQTLSGIFIGIAVLAFLIAAFVVGILLYKKRHVYFYRDDSKQHLLLEILQDKKIEIFTATYTLREPGGNVLARFRKNYLYDILRKRWYVYAPDGSTLCIAKEDSVLMSILRRLLGPLFGALRTNFIILQGDTENQIGEFNRKFTLLDRYVLDMSADAGRILDRRTAVALGVLLDTGERR